MKKTIYEAPSVEQINVRFEENIMNVVSVQSVGALNLSISDGNILNGTGEGEEW